MDTQKSRRTYAKKRAALFGAAVALAGGLLSAGCASTPAGGLLTGFAPSFSNVNGSSAKTGTAESKVWLGFLGTTSYPQIKTAAKKANITKIATVEYYKKPGILCLWTEYKTIVTGE